MNLKLRKFLFFLSALLIFQWGGVAFSVGNEKSVDGFALAKKIISKYKESHSVRMSVEKKTLAGLLRKEYVSEGVLFYSKGKVRIDFDKPEKSILIINDSFLWMAKLLPESLGGKWQVTKMDRQKIPSDHALMALLFGDNKVWDKLELVQQKASGDNISLILKAKKPEYLPGLVKVAIVVDSSVNEIRVVKQWDDRENEIQFKFDSMQFDHDFEKNFFEYTPPKNAEITVL